MWGLSEQSCSLLLFLPDTSDEAGLIWWSVTDRVALDDDWPLFCWDGAAYIISGETSNHSSLQRKRALSLKLNNNSRPYFLSSSGIISSKLYLAVLFGVGSSRLACCEMSCRSGRSEPLLEAAEYLPFPNLSILFKNYSLNRYSAFMFQEPPYSPPNGCLTMTFSASLAKRVPREPLYLYPQHTS